MELVAAMLRALDALDALEARLVWRTAWVALSVVGLLAFRFSFFRAFVLQGRLRTPVALSRLPGLALLHLEVSKRCWTWFYLVGAVHSLVVLLAVLLVQSHPIVQAALQFLQSSSDHVTVQSDTILFLALFGVHVARRFLESALVTQFGDAKMHAGVFAVGCFHYMAATLSALSDPAAVTPKSDTIMNRVLAVLGLAVYAVASYHQNVCNSLIARQKRANGMKYVIPRGDWFDHVRCPLYSTDILLYVAFLLVTGGINVMLYFTFVWVVVNQTLLAKFNSEWSDAKFRDRKHEFPRWKLLPYVW